MMDQSTVAMVVAGDQYGLCQFALIFALTRCIMSIVLKIWTKSIILSYTNQAAAAAASSSSSSCSLTSPSSLANLRELRENLSLTTVGNIRHRLPESKDLSCAVCLNKLKKNNQVWELNNCCHMFHNKCLERWVSYDNRLTCPLCRASLITVPHRSSPPPPPPQPRQQSWAVERVLYLLGDDLLPC